MVTEHKSSRLCEQVQSINIEYSSKSFSVIQVFLCLFRQIQEITKGKWKVRPILTTHASVTGSTLIYHKNRHCVAVSY